MKDKNIIIHLALNRGSLSTEKRQILKNRVAGASPSFLRLTQIIIHVILLVFIYPNCSTVRIYEHTNLNSSIILRIMIKFNLLICDKSKAKHIYNITPLTRCIISDLIEAYKHNLNTFHALNVEDKKADYLQIKAKIKTLKEK
jgi:hypothetical protein